MPKTLRVPDHVRSVIDADGAVLLDIRQGKYFSLNGIGLDIWRQIEAGQSMPEIEAFLERTYDSPRDALCRDLAEFVQLLQRRQLVDARD